jgi:hypothetical protein
MQSLKVSNAFAYLQALLHRPIDYSFLTARMNADEEAAAHKSDERAKEEDQTERVRALAGKSRLRGLTATSGRSRSTAC